MEKRTKHRSIYRWAGALVMATVVAIAAPMAFGQPMPRAGKPKVYVFPFIKGAGVSDVVFNKAEQYFMTLFKMSTKFELLTDEEVKDSEADKQKLVKRAATQVSAPWLEAADNHLWQGKDLLVKKDYQKAIRKLNKGKKLYEEHYLELRDYDKLVDVNLQLAIAFFQAGYKDNGEELLKDVLVWRPTLVVDRKKYPKEFVNSLESLKVLLEGRKGGKVRVEVAPAEGAKVYVDGLLKGTLGGGKKGIDVSGLYRGKHYVQVIKEGYEIWAQKVGVPSPGRTKKVAATLSEAKVEVVSGGGDWEGLGFKVYEFANTGEYGMKFSKQAKVFADRVQVPYLLFGFVSAESRGTKLTLFLFKAEWSGLAEVEPVGFDENLTNLQVNLLFLEANLSSALTKFPKNKVVRGTPEVYKRSQELAAKMAQPEPVKPVEPVVKVEPVRPVEPVVKVEPVRPVEPVVRPVEPVVRPVEPVRVTPTFAEEDPYLPSRTEPTNEVVDEDLGELSSIFADSGDSNDDPILGSGIPTDPDRDWGGNKGVGDDAITKKWWFWTGIAAGAGLLGGGGYLLYDELSGAPGGGGYSASFKWGDP